MKFFTTSRISDNIHTTPEGYLVCLGVAIARTGEMIYGPGETPLESGEDGKVIVSRTPDELFRTETIASFEGKSFTIQHPNDFLSPENWAGLTNGIGYNVRRGIGEQENDLVCDILITTKRAIELVKGGLREISCGYEAEYLQTGVGRGIQKNILGNHLALVEEGRAGSSYAIIDHKGKGSMKKLTDKIKAIFGKAQDDALALVAAEETTDKGTPAPAKDDVTVAGQPPAGQPGATPGGTSTIEERMAKLEALVASIAEKLSGTADADKDKGDKEEKAEDADKEKEEKAEDADGEEKETDDADGEEEESEDEEMCDEDFETGDTASRVEILAPGMNVETKDVKRKALVACYATKDGKAAIDQFTAGKAPNLKSDKTVDTLFVGVSEVLKTRRNAELSETRTKGRVEARDRINASTMTAEKINEINAKIYASK